MGLKSSNSVSAGPTSAVWNSVHEHLLRVAPAAEKIVSARVFGVQWGKGGDNGKGSSGHGAQMTHCPLGTTSSTLMTSLNSHRDPKK